MFDKLDDIQKRYTELTEKLSTPSVINNPKLLQEYSKELSSIEPAVRSYHELKKLHTDLEAAVEMAENESDPEMKELAENEQNTLTERIEQLEIAIKKMLIPVDPLDKKSIFIEIRAGTGGTESTLFAAELYRMYTKYAETRNWAIEIMHSNNSDLGGYKEIIFSVVGKNVYSRLKFESGVHRVQRVPVTETSGRIHTSAATVAVLPEADDVDIEINAYDLKVDVYRSSGPGGQSVNTTDSAVRITHMPTGTVVCCQDEKSQHKNKARAMKILRARLFDLEKRKQAQKIAADRKNQVGSGDRSERIRTYNYPQNRVTDHRVNLTLYELESVLDGHLDKIIDTLQEANIIAKLQNLQ